MDTVGVCGELRDDGRGWRHLHMYPSFPLSFPFPPSSLSFNLSPSSSPSLLPLLLFPPSSSLHPSIPSFLLTSFPPSLLLSIPPYLLPLPSLLPSPFPFPSPLDACKGILDASPPPPPRCPPPLNVRPGASRGMSHPQHHLHKPLRGDVKGRGGRRGYREDLYR